MSRLQINRAPHVLKWVHSSFSSSNSNFYVKGLHHIVQNPRFYGTRSCTDVINGLGFGGNEKKARAVREAESALADYFHFTRNLEFMDAENMSRNSPDFFTRLMTRVDIGDDTIIYDDTINRAVMRFLRYHPVNEFEAFFESIEIRMEADRNTGIWNEVSFSVTGPVKMEDPHLVSSFVDHYKGVYLHTTVELVIEAAPLLNVR